MNYKMFNYMVQVWSILAFLSKTAQILTIPVKHSVISRVSANKIS